MANTARTNPPKKPKRGLGRGLSALISAKPVPVNPGPEGEGTDTERTVSSEPFRPKPVSPDPSFSAAGAVAKRIAEEEAGSSPSGRQDSASATQASSVAEQSRSESTSGQVISEQSDALKNSAVGISEKIRYIQLSSIQRNEQQPRQQFQQSEIDELAESIRTLGVLQPVLVRPVNKGTDHPVQYQIVAGERRWRAATQVKLERIPAIVRDFDDRETLEVAIVENVQRSNLSPLEEAEAYQRLIDDFSLSQREVAEKVGKDRASVANYVRLLKLPAEVRSLLAEQKITMGHAKAILTVKEPSAQVSLARKVIEEGLSVRALEEIVSRVVVLDTKKPRRARASSAEQGDFPEVVDRIRKALGTKVKIKHHPSGRGRIEVEYFSEEELDRLVERLT